MHSDGLEDTHESKDQPDNFSSWPDRWRPLGRRRWPTQWQYSTVEGRVTLCPFSGAGTVYSATTGTAISTCTGTCPVVAGEILGTPITFTSTRGDHRPPRHPPPRFGVIFTPAFGGLGLQTASGPAGTGDDQIEGTGILRLHFASAVTLTGVATLFDPTHDDFGSGSPLTGSFLFCAGNSACTPGTQVTFSEANSANGTLGTPSTGTDFAFAETSELVEMLNSTYLH